MQTDAIKKVLPPEMQKVNHESFQKLIPYVDTKGFESEKYINAIENYNKNVDKTGIEYSDKNDFVEITFDYLFDKSMKELGLQDLPENWGKIIKNSQKYLSDINTDDITKAYQQRNYKLKNK